MANPSGARTLAGYIPSNAVRAARRVVAGCVLLVLSAAAWSQSRGADASAPQAATANETGSYLIGPGDSLSVFVWREPDLSVVVPVRPDGRISTPLVKDMVAVGKTPTELGGDIERVLAEFIRSPQVTISVQDFVGTFGSQVRVLGQVVMPGPVPYRERMTLLDALLEAGGLTEFAAGNRSQLVRTVDGKTEKRRVKLADLLKRGDLDENLLVQPGDIIVVPEAVF